ncbi:MAG: VWA domain-containing protein [Spirochaetaceae bacterium]|nr:MAG: VWA domain-containing protein [Spirochaetaceae bacterium]
MNVHHPQYLWGLLLLAPAVFMQIRGYYLGRRTLRRLYGGSLPPHFAAIYYVKWFFSSLFVISAFVFLLLGLSGINWGSRPVEDNRANMEVVFVVDVSNSMLAADVLPSRLQRAIELMRGTIHAIPGARFGVVAFKGEGVNLIPVTENRYAFDFLEKMLVPESITAPWSDLNQGLRAGAKAFPQGSNRNGILVLLSDGEAQGAAPLAFAGELGKAGIPVAAITLGSPDGSVIPSGEQGAPLRDSRDKVVITKANPELMQSVASASQGIHLLASDPGSLGGLIGFLEEHSEQNAGFRLVEVDRYRLFVLLGLLMIVFHELVRIIRWKGVL